MDDSERARRAKAIKGLLLRLLAMLVLFYAASAGVLTVYLLQRLFFSQLLFGSERLNPELFLLIPAVAALSGGLGWIGLRLGRAGSLPYRCARALSAAADAFLRAKPAGVKPEPAGDAFRGLD